MLTSPLMKQRLPAWLQGLLVLQQRLSQAQTEEFRLVTLPAMPFLDTAPEGPSQAPSCTLTPGRTHGLSPIPCTEHRVPYRELKAAAEHVFNSNTWVILLMISSCLSALLDLSQAAPCLAKLSSKWDKTSPMRRRQGKDVTPTCSCQEWVICGSGGEHTLCKAGLVLY